MSYIPIDTRKKIIFLGTPQVAAEVLKILLKAQNFLKIILVVSQPPARSSRGGSATPSPVHSLALSEGIPVLTPQSAKAPEFLESLALLSPDLCVTAAYGQYLPKSFLAIPKFGTLNIHPSLLPLYRGAAPVQRALSNGESTTGVSVLLSSAQMDAGPIVAQEEYLVNEEIKSPELLRVLFEKGANLLVRTLPAYFANKVTITEQDHAKATKAEKIKTEEGLLDFSAPAHVLHNKVRAFADWPTTKASFVLGNKILEVKIITTRVRENTVNLRPGELSFSPDGLCICCGDKKILEILEIQLPGKKLMSAKDFQNGLQNKDFRVVSSDFDEEKSGNGK